MTTDGVEITHLSGLFTIIANPGVIPNIISNIILFLIL